MSGIWGRKIKYSIFGESHGSAIGITIDGLPSGFELDLDEVRFEMARRAPGKDEYSTQRNECDEFEILSGYFENRTTGTPLCAIIRNTNQKSKDYDELKRVIRPGHADYTGYIKYDGFNDPRGGGHFSGRITAPLVFAGAIAKQILKKRGIIIGAHIAQINNIFDDEFDKININEEFLNKIKLKRFAVVNENQGQTMKNSIVEAKNNLDSVGGIIETAVVNLPVGLGDPFFDSVESLLAHMMFSVPSVKGIEFGAGFEFARMLGSNANDEYFIENNNIRTLSNNNGGILGGITNGMPLIFKVVIKPTASISKKQQTVNILKMENEEISVNGRHDPCIVQRAVPVIEGATAIVLLDLM